MSRAAAFTVAPGVAQPLKETFCATLTGKLDALVCEIEAQNVSFKGWATPGATVNAAALDIARTTCRRAERRCAALHELKQLENAEILIYLNRLSDALWLLARWVETRHGALIQ